MVFKPLGKRLLVKRVEEGKTTASGIYIPDNAKEKPLKGIVKAISEELQKDCGCSNEGSCLKEGDQVVFGKYKGNEIKLGEEEYIVLDFEDVLGVIK